MADVAEYLGVTERTVRSWQRIRGLPHLVIGGSVRFRQAEVEAWAESHQAVQPVRR